MKLCAQLPLVLVAVDDACATFVRQRQIGHCSICAKISSDTKKEKHFRQLRRINRLVVIYCLFFFFCGVFRVFLLLSFIRHFTACARRLSHFVDQAINFKFCLFMHRKNKTTATECRRCRTNSIGTTTNDERRLNQNSIKIHFLFSESSSSPSREHNIRSIRLIILWSQLWWINFIFIICVYKAIQFFRFGLLISSGFMQMHFRRETKR